MAHQSSVQRASVTSYSPGPTQTVDLTEQEDLTPSDSQPPGVDENEPQSLEDALTSLQGSGDGTSEQDRPCIGTGPVRRIPFAVQTVGKDLQK